MVIKPDERKVSNGRSRLAGPGQFFFFVTQILMRDLFAVANLLVSNVLNNNYYR